MENNEVKQEEITPERRSQLEEAYGKSMADFLALMQALQDTHPTLSEGLDRAIGQVEVEDRLFISRAIIIAINYGRNLEANKSRIILPNSIN